MNKNTEIHKERKNARMKEFKRNNEIILRTSPFHHERVYVSEEGEQVEWLVKSWFVPV